MPYIGRGLTELQTVEKLDNITFTNSAGPYNLTKSSAAFTPVSANHIILSIDGVVQYGNFTVSSSTITFDSSISSTSTCDFILHIATALANVPTDGSVTNAKLATSVITGQTELTSAPANDDLFLIYDTSATSLKKLQKSYLNPTLSYSSGTATGNGSTTAFTISSGRTVEDVLVFVNGFQLTPTTDYTISGTTLTFTTAPASSAEITFRYLPIPGAYTSANFTGNGSSTTITIDSGRAVNDVLVVVNGLTLVPTDDYTISGTTLTFATAPANLAEITVRYLRLS
jgi:hypothetical protein